MQVPNPPPLGYIPMGTTNDVASTLGLPKNASSVGARSIVCVSALRRSPQTPETGSQMNSGVWAISLKSGMAFLPHQSCSPSKSRGRC